MRLVFRLRRYGHITDALAILHWLRVPQRVDFKIAVMAYVPSAAWSGSAISWFVLLTCLVVAPAACVHQRQTS